MTSTFGEFVKLRREELGLDQAALAKEVGVNQQTVSKWEQAKAVPRPQRIRRLAAVLRVDASDLMTHAGFLPAVASEGQDDEPPNRLMGDVASMTNDQLILLIERAWEEFRGRAGRSLRVSRRVPAEEADL